jgi:hypothetical protein
VALVKEISTTGAGSTPYAKDVVGLRFEIGPVGSSGAGSSGGVVWNSWNVSTELHKTGAINKTEYETAKAQDLAITEREPLTVACLSRNVCHEVGYDASNKLARSEGRKRLPFMKYSYTQ